jgi:hypothetical protein
MLEVLVIHFVHGQWFSLASSITKAGCLAIAEILQRVVYIVGKTRLHERVNLSFKIIRCVKCIGQTIMNLIGIARKGYIH